MPAPEQPASGLWVAAETVTPNHLLASLRRGGVWMRGEFRLTQIRHMVFDCDGQYVATFVRPERAWARTLAALLSLPVGFVVLITAFMGATHLSHTWFIPYLVVVPLTAMWAAMLVFHRLIVPSESLRGGKEHGDLPEMLRITPRFGTLFTRRYEVSAGGVVLGRAEQAHFRALGWARWRVYSADGTVMARVEEMRRQRPKHFRSVAKRIMHAPEFDAFRPDGKRIGRLRPRFSYNGYWWLESEAVPELDPRLMLACLFLQRQWGFDGHVLRRISAEEADTLGAVPTGDGQDAATGA